MSEKKNWCLIQNFLKFTNIFFSVTRQTKRNSCIASTIYLAGQVIVQQMFFSKFSKCQKWVYVLGGRKNYSAHGCSSILKRCISPNEQLTCPFEVSDDKDLMLTLEEYLERSFAEKVILSREDPLKACSMVIFYKTGLEVKRISKPSKFFNLSVLNSSEMW